MVLDLETIKNITCGAVTVTPETDGIHFYRLTRQQLDYYRETNEAFYKKALATAGIKLSFKTNSQNLKLDLTLQPVMARTYAAVEVYVNGMRVDCIHNFGDSKLSGSYATKEFPLGRYKKTVQLGEGEKTVCIHFPRLINTVLHSIELEAGAFCQAVKPEKKALIFGDSITQGFDCLWPSSHYVEQLCRVLHAEEYNKSIGGEQFAPALAACKDALTPDYIIVAYGTNDWRCATVKDFQDNCRGFFKNLCKNYPGVPVIAITPVWRANMETVRDSVCFDTIHEIEAYIRQVTADYNNITVIHGFALIPHDPGYFGDLHLHPSDEGFTHYGKNLIHSLKNCGFLPIENL